MKTMSISDLKAGLSAALRIVRRGHEVIVTDRGRPVARLVPIAPVAADVEDLHEAGLIRLGTRRLPRGFFLLDRPPDPEGSLREAVLEEREGGY